MAILMNWPKPKCRDFHMCEKLINQDGRIPVYMSGSPKSVEVLGIIYFMA